MAVPLCEHQSARGPDHRGRVGTDALERANASVLTGGGVGATALLRWMLPFPPLAGRCGVLLVDMIAPPQAGFRSDAA